MNGVLVLDADSDRARVIAPQAGGQQIISDQDPRALVFRDAQPHALVRQDKRQVVLRQSSDPVPVIREAVPQKLLVSGMPGPQGPIGPVGPAGRDGDKTFYFTQSAPSTEWVIVHNLGKFPAVVVVDSNGEQVVGTLKYLSDNALIITFAAPFSGDAYLN